MRETYVGSRPFATMLGNNNRPLRKERSADPSYSWRRGPFFVSLPNLPFNARRSVARGVTAVVRAPNPPGLASPRTDARECTLRPLSRAVSPCRAPVVGQCEAPPAAAVRHRRAATAAVLHPAIPARQCCNAHMVSFSTWGPFFVSYFTIPPKRRFATRADYCFLTW